MEKMILGHGFEFKIKRNKHIYFFCTNKNDIYYNNNEAPCTRRATSDSPNKNYTVIVPSKERHKMDENNYW